MRLPQVRVGGGHLLGEVGGTGEVVQRISQLCELQEERGRGIAGHGVLHLLERVQIVALQDELLSQRVMIIGLGNRRALPPRIHGGRQRAAGGHPQPQDQRDPSGPVHANHLCAPAVSGSSKRNLSLLLIGLTDTARSFCSRGRNSPCIPSIPSNVLPLVTRTSTRWLPADTGSVRTKRVLLPVPLSLSSSVLEPSMRISMRPELKRWDKLTRRRAAWAGSGAS